MSTPTTPTPALRQTGQLRVIYYASYLRETSASRSRLEKTQDEIYIRQELREAALQKRVKPHSSPPPDAHDDVNSCPTWDLTPAQIEEPPNCLDSNDSTEPDKDILHEKEHEKELKGPVITVPTIEDVSRLNDDWEWETWKSKYDYNSLGNAKVIADIDSMIGFEYLRRALNHVQQVVYPFFAERNPDFVRAGPSLLALGYHELLNMIGYSSYPALWLNVNGYSRHQVHEALMDVVALRNRVAHPDPYNMSDAECLDTCLKLAQVITCILRDWERTMDIRRMRDHVAVLMAESHDIVENLRHLAMLTPFEGFDCPDYIKAMF
ncbi:hypothetical protein F5Y16DRAFT_423117 [Xylariaceae sp. FL0255]|nr:hypothetical protein F5Y16DRAFT_423117 [Xylariaceae sp. FL0255]